MFDFSLIIPVYKNEANIDDLLAALRGLGANIPNLEVVFVVDGSPDRSWDFLHRSLSDQPYASQLILLSRNFGAFAAIRTGLENARGKIMAVMAADLQEPPELMNEIFRLLSSGQYDVAIGQRAGRNDSPMGTVLSNCYWGLYRRLIVPEIPPGGVDIFGCTRQVAEDLLKMREANTSMVAQLFWVGYRRVAVPYHRRLREKGQSAWTFKKKILYFLNSILSFSDLPLMLLLWLGLVGLVMSLLVALITIIGKLSGTIAVDGYTTLVLINLFVFFILMLSQGVLGCYVWRCFENTKQRPLTLVQRVDLFGDNIDKQTLDRKNNELCRP